MERECFLSLKSPAPKVLDEEYENPFGHRLFFLQRQVIGNPCRQALRSERRTSRSKKVQFVLELNLNGFRTMGIRIGDRLDLEAVSKALRQRQLDPKEYGLP